MASLLDASKPRINCSMLSQHIGRGVCFVGRVEKVHPTGKTFSVSDGEGKSATVELNEPVSTAIIYGISLPTRFRVSGGALITLFCHSYVVSHSMFLSVVNTFNQ
uniref:Uncharacterized protein n=1 Tax=Neolamprologus brichardi TaxID=32507 RepID=A0A3Q4I4C9_NEOBR